MPDPDVFNNTNDQGQPAPQPNQADPFADQLAGIKNEDGKPKYDTLEKALDGLANAQSYIPQLKETVSTQEAEINQLKAKLEQMGSVEEVVSRLQNQGQQAPEQVATPPASPAFNPEDVSALVQQELAKVQQQSVAQTNAQKVSKALSDAYGAEANKVVTERATALGTTPAGLQELASKNPDMVLALFNTPTINQQVSTPTAGSVNIPPIKPQGREELTPPEQSMLSGATSAQQKEFMLKVQQDVYARLGVNK